MFGKKFTDVTYKDDTDRSVDLMKQVIAGTKAEYSVDKRYVKIEVTDPDNYGYDAFRVNWRMANDANDPRAQAILSGLGNFFRSQIALKGTLLAGYDMTGNGTAKFSDVAPSAGAVIGLLAARDATTANAIYKSDITVRYHTNGNYWGQQFNYYSQNWGAFVTEAITVRPQK